MAILLDIGNTSMTYAVALGSRLRKFRSIPYADIPQFVRNISLSGGDSEGKHIVLVSVVPSVTRLIRASLATSMGWSHFEAGRELPITIAHRYRKPASLGLDRLVNLYGGLAIRRPPFLVIDFGTAVSFDYVSRRGVFEGGMIVPGPQISFQALLAKAALIPKSLRLPEKSISFLGKTTYDCISSGVLRGYGAMTDGLIARFRSRFSSRLAVLITGGFAAHLRAHIKTRVIYDPMHSLKSLFLLYKNRAGR